MEKLVKCKSDFGCFKMGKTYYIRRIGIVDEYGIKDSVWDIFFGDKPIGGGRNILGIDLKDFFEDI